MWWGYIDGTTMTGNSGADLYLVIDKLGPLEHLLINELRKNEVTASPLLLSNAELEQNNYAAAILTSDAIRAYAVSALFGRSANPPKSYELTMNRLLLYRELGDKAPKSVVAFTPEPVATIIRERGLQYLGTLNPALGLDGAVTGWEGGKSVAEHRIYMENPFARVNVVMMEPRNVIKAVVIGDKCFNCINSEELAMLAAEKASCVFCEVFIGVNDGASTVMGINASIEVSADVVKPLSEALARWLHE
jgi:hypothetical protein